LKSADAAQKTRKDFPWLTIEKIGPGRATHFFFRTSCFVRPAVSLC
jgi:hypothetical protein